MKIELIKIDFQLIESLFFVLEQISKVEPIPTTLQNNFDSYKNYYEKVVGLIDVYDNTGLDNNVDLDIPQTISEKRYSEFLRYEIIYKAIDSIELEDESFNSYKEYYYLVRKQLNIYYFLEKEKEAKKVRARDFFNMTESEKDVKIKALEETLENYRNFNKLLGEMKFSDNTPYSEVKEFLVKEIKEFNKRLD
jgi:hypothetical protein